MTRFSVTRISESGRRHPLTDLFMGLLVLPHMLFFQFFVPLIAPLFDLLILIGSVSGEAKKALTIFGIYLLMEFVVSFIAFRMEKLSIKPLPPLFL